MDYLGRIDFAKWVMDGPYDVVMKIQAEIGDTFVYEYGRADYKKDSNQRSGGYHDGQRKTHVAWIEISGPVSQDVVEAFGWRYSQYLNRLDWRVSLDYEAFTYEEMYRAMKFHRSSGVTFTEMDSRVRQKQGRRDSGGESLYSGAAGSDKRLVYYKRGNEKAAVEARALQMECKLIVKRAMARWESGSCSTPLDCLTEQLDEYSEVLFHERTGFSWRVVTGQEQRNEQNTLYTHQESLLNQIAGLVSQLDNEAKGALVAGLWEEDDVARAEMRDLAADGSAYSALED